MDLLKLLGTFNQECAHAEAINESSFIERTSQLEQLEQQVELDKDKDKEQEKQQQQEQEQVQQQEKQQGYRTIVQCILANFDPMYQGVPEDDRRLFLKQRTMEVGTQLEESPTEFYQSYGFNPKTMKPKLIQLSFQQSLETKSKSNKTLSSLLYLNEFYQRNFTIVTDNHYVSTCLKDFPVETIVYQKGYYKLITVSTADKTEVSLEESGIPIQSDLGKTGLKAYVYQTSLEPISKYKSEELKSLCTENGLSLKKDKDGKAKLKVTLYHELYLKLVQG